MGSKKYKTFLVSQRHKDAITKIGKPKIMEGVAYFREHPEFIIQENVGVGEETVTLSMPLLDEDIEGIEIVQLISSVIGRTAVVRNSIEYLINKYSMEEFRKPKGWQSKPLALRQGGENPIKAIAGDAECISLSADIYEETKFLFAPIGYAHENRPNFSRFTRIVLKEIIGMEEIATQLQTVKKDKRATSFILLPEMSNKISVIARYLRCSRSDVISAYIKAYLSRHPKKLNELQQELMQYTQIAS